MPAAQRLIPLHLRVTPAMRDKLDQLATGSGISRAAAGRIILSTALHNIDHLEDTRHGEDH